MTFMRPLARKWDQHDAIGTARAREAFRELAEDLFEEQRREEAIAALPTVIWKGRTLHTLRCVGDFGKGPHDMNVPESILWTLISFERFRCPYHS